MIVVTSLKKTNPGTQHSNGVIGVGYNNHNPLKSNVMFAFDAVFEKLVENKAVYADRKEFKEQVMIPAFEKAGSTNPKAMADNIFSMILKEGKILEV